MCNTYIFSLYWFLLKLKFNGSIEIFIFKNTLNDVNQQNIEVN